MESEAEPGDSDTAANQRFITQPSSLLPSGDSHHLYRHSQGGEPWWDSFCIRLCVCVCLSPTNTIILSWFLLLPHRLINHSWEQRGVSIDKTNIALGEKTLPVDILSHLIHPSFKFHTKLNLCHCLTRLYHPQLKQTCVTTVFFFPQHRLNIVLNCELFDKD